LLTDPIRIVSARTTIALFPPFAVWGGCPCFAPCGDAGFDAEAEVGTDLREKDIPSWFSTIEVPTATMTTMMIICGKFREIARFIRLNSFRNEKRYFSEASWFSESHARIKQPLLSS
jgi:hypothetical protein